MITFTSDQITIINYLLLINVAWSTLSHNISDDIKQNLENHKLLSHVLIIMILFNMLYNMKADNSPFATLMSAIVVYACFIILVSQKYITFMILLFLILIIYMVNVNVEFYDKKGELNTRNRYRSIAYILQIITIITALSGFAYYSYDKNKFYHQSL